MESTTYKVAKATLGRRKGDGGDGKGAVLPRTPMVRLPLILAALLLLAACESPVRQYPGPERPFAEVARLCCHVAEPHGSLIGAKLRIVSIDGRAFGYSETWAEILPGRHEVRYAWLEGIGAWPIPVLPLAGDEGTLVFEARPGRGYILKADRQDGRTWAWIEDEASRALVAGARPPA